MTLAKSFKIGLSAAALMVFAGATYACPAHDNALDDALETVKAMPVLASKASIPTSLSSATLSPREDLQAEASRPSEAAVLQRADDTAGAVMAIPLSPAMTTPAPKSEPVQMAENKTDSIADTHMDTPEKPWNAALETYVALPDASGLARFDYAGLKASATDEAALTEYIAALESQDPGAMSQNEAIAYWANLYNAVTVKVVIDNYPVSSIKKIGGGVFSSGPWKEDRVTVNGTAMSLDDIEHGTMRKQFPSPLIHYMVNCASVGCPNLKDGLWVADSLDADRDAAARAFINSPRGAKITPKGLEVSSIYKWFDEDFGGNKKGVLAHLSKYAEGDLKSAIDGGAKIIGYDYDWSLNE